MTGDRDDSQLERRLRAALETEATAYDVSPGALGDLRRRTRRRTVVRTPLRLGLAAACAVAAVTGVAVLPTQLGGSHRASPSTIESTPSGVVAGPVPSVTDLLPAPDDSATPPPIVAPPPATTASSLLDLGFTADRVVLAGDDAYVFGLDPTGAPVGARLDVGHGAPTVAVAMARMPGRVCSGSIDAGLLVVVLADGRDCTYRGTIYVLDSVSLGWGGYWDEGAREGDVLVRPEGVYDVDAGVLQLRDRRTLVVKASHRIAPMSDIVNLAGDPADRTFVATTYAMHATTTRVILESRDSFTEVAHADLAGASEGAIAYATRTGFWLPFTGSGGVEVPLLTGPELGTAGQAFPGIAAHSFFALSARRLWSLDAGTHQLSCANLTTGATTGATRLGNGGALAADATHVYVLPVDDTVLQTLTPSGVCG